MFGKNEIVGKKYFKGYKNDTLLVTSRFYTLQGEGPLSGKPAVFLRLAKCQLSCSFCDTYFDSGTVMSFSEIRADLWRVISEFYKGSTPGNGWIRKNIALVITGGEPTLQTNLTEFIEQAYMYFDTIQIESNGISYLPASDSLIYVVSPKCMEVEGVPTRYLKPNPQVLERATCLKFVMSALDETKNPYSSVPDWAHDWRARTLKNIYVSPMNIYKKEPAKAKKLRAEVQGDIPLEVRSEVDEVISFWEDGLLDMKANQRNHEYAAKYCMKYGFNLNLQVHLYASLA